MATPFENFVNDELPKRVSTNDDPLNTPAGLVPVSTGIGLGIEFQDPAIVFPGGGDALTPAGLQTLLNDRGYTVKDLVKVLGDTGAVTANSGLFNFLFLFDKRIEQELEETDKVSQYMVEMGRMEAEGYSYWKNEIGNGTEPALPAIPESEVRLFDDGRLQIGSLTNYIEFALDGGVILSVDGATTTFSLTAMTLLSDLDPADVNKVLMHAGDRAEWREYPFTQNFNEHMASAGFSFDEINNNWFIDQGVME